MFWLKTVDRYLDPLGRENSIQIDALNNAISKADDDDEQPSQSPLEGRDQLGKDEQACCWRQ